MNWKLILWGFGLLVLEQFPLTANPAQWGRMDPNTLEPETLLGMTLEEGFQRFGPPQQVGTVRGTEPWQDDVLFIYSQGVSLFWFQDRVWQIRLSASFPGKVRGIQIGDSRDRVVEILGFPYYTEKDWILYHFEGPSYPIRLRVFFREGLVEDMYLYRGDF
ncbi:MAG: hypothetical protein N2442_12080 [Spirochaetes bacterium]|nr:hypothetical protein [Spirochaetota bacterium]